MNSLNIIFQHFKLAIAIIMCLILTFAIDIKILQEKFILIAIFIVLILMILSNITEDLGIILLLLALFIISYNNIYIQYKK
jgi:hypothetical protein